MKKQLMAIVAVTLYFKHYEENGVKVKEAAVEKESGLQAVYLTPTSGSWDNAASVVSGTIAQSLGLEAGKSYSLSAKLKAVDPEYGPQYQIVNHGEVGALELFSAVQKGHVALDANVSTSMTDFKEGKMVVAVVEDEQVTNPVTVD